MTLVRHNYWNWNHHSSTTEENQGLFTHTYKIQSYDKVIIHTTFTQYDNQVPLACLLCSIPRIALTFLIISFPFTILRWPWSFLFEQDFINLCHVHITIIIFFIKQGVILFGVIVMIVSLGVLCSLDMWTGTLFLFNLVRVCCWICLCRANQHNPKKKFNLYK